LSIVHQVEHEIKDREASFHIRMEQAIQNTRHSVEEECHAQQERAVSQTKEDTRKEVTEQLLNRFHLEVCKLEANFDRRLQEVTAQAEASEHLKIETAVAATKETARQQALEEAKNEYQSKLDEMENLIALLNESATATATEWQVERHKFQERIGMLERVLETVNAVRTEKLDEYKELERKLDEAVQSKAQLQHDLERAVSELNGQMQATAKVESDHATHGEVAAIVQSEMVRVRLRLEEIEKIMADPATELGSEIRLNRECAELQAYLKGLRYSLGEVTLQPANSQESCHA
jgi:hypothetical protein